MNCFPIDTDRLQRLASTRGGRVALVGFEYQRAFALLRLVSMLTGRAVKGTVDEVPVLLRYEWAEDIDELGPDGRVTLWQCKAGVGWTAPAALAALLVGFAPKLLWTPVVDRHRLRFRLVSSDPAYAAHAELPGKLPSRALVRKRFLDELSKPPGPGSDRALWQADADTQGHSTLFDAIWDRTAVLFVADLSVLPAQAVWPAEDEALSVLARAHRLTPGVDGRRVVQALRGLLGVDPPLPDSGHQVPRPASAAPMWLRPIDVADCLHPHSPLPAGLDVRLTVVDRTRLLGWQAQPPGQRFVARRPEWPDVVRGTNQVIGFFERTATDALVARLRQALADSLGRTGHLRLQWVVGAPGAGKSTLALRVAARLIEEGACSVVDARYALGEDVDTALLANELRRLADGPRPLLLLLDDPLGVGSRWPALLQALSPVSPAVVVLAATPDFLLQRHRHELRDVAQLPLFELKRPDAAERADLARLYPGLNQRALLSDDEELLVLAMQAAADERFDDIIRGQWRTLAGGQALAESTLGRELPWEVAAFWLVVFFHRAYTACPLALLEGVLGQRPDGADAAERLTQLVDAKGWRIFQLINVRSGRFGSAAASVRAMHARVAQRAWHCRPARAWSVADAIAQASLRKPSMARRLADCLATLHETDRAAAATVLEAIAKAWAQADASQVETQHLCEMTAAWTVNRIPLPRSLNTVLHDRARLCEPQSWLAALKLMYLRNPDRLDCGTLDLQYDRLIDAADFSVAPGRAVTFAHALKGRPAQWQRMVQRVWRAFDDSLDWPVDGVLVTWLLTQGSAHEVLRRVSALLAWLTDHPDD